MSGLEKIIDSITSEANDKASELVYRAEAEAGNYLADSKARTSEDSERIIRKAKAEAQSIKERSVASAELKKKQILLSGKQELISETIEMAKKYVGDLSDADYLDILKAVFGKHVPKADAVLRFSERDLKRIPEAFTAELIKTAADSGSKLTVSEEPADIKDGFIIDFGGIEENCSFEALIDQSLEDIQDSVNKKLFT